MHLKSIYAGRSQRNILTRQWSLQSLQVPFSSVFPVGHEAIHASISVTINTIKGREGKILIEKYKLMKNNIYCIIKQVPTWTFRNAGVFELVTRIHYRFVFIRANVDPRHFWPHRPSSNRFWHAFTGRNVKDIIQIQYSIFTGCFHSITRAPKLLIYSEISL